MADQQFQPGDVVRLKSGGPRMTVVNYGKYGMAATKESYKCKWFDDKNKLVEDTFTEAELEREKSSGPVSLERG
jgi:uncharacterized protein YodC (DUF2158 family)